MTLSDCYDIFIIFTRFHYCFFLFFFNDTATTEIYTLSLHDALPISRKMAGPGDKLNGSCRLICVGLTDSSGRSEEHTSELQSPCNLVCRLLLEKKKKRQETKLESILIAVYTGSSLQRHRSDGEHSTF